MRMSLGEKVSFLCPANTFYGKTDYTFEFELVKIEENYLDEL